MIEAIIYALILIVVAAIVVYVVLYVLGAIGIGIPPKIVQLIWIVFMLLALLWLLRAVLPAVGVALP